MKYGWQLKSLGKSAGGGHKWRGGSVIGGVGGGGGGGQSDRTVAIDKIGRHRSARAKQ